MPTIRATIYTRVSTTGQIDGTSLDTQEAACRRIADAIPAEVVYHRQDAGVSGELYLARPGIQQALQDVKDGRTQILIIYKLDRSGRNVDVVRTIAREIAEAGARLFFTDDGEVFFHGTGKAVFTMKAVFAEMEKDIIRERTMNGKLRLAEGGVQTNRGMRPYGYTIVTAAHILRGTYPADKVGTYVIDPVEAPWAAAIFARYAEGNSLREVARYLQDQGVPPPSHAPDRLARYQTPPRNLWHPASIKSILDNPIYVGIGTLGKRRRKVDERRISDPESPYKRADYNVRQPKESWVLIKGVAPPLVEQEVFDTCQARLKQNPNIRGGNPTYRYLFTGMLVCPICKRGLYGCRSRKGGSLYVSYRCRDYAPGARADRVVCNRRHYNERLLLGCIEHVLGIDADLLEAAFSAHKRRMSRDISVDEMSQIERQIAALGTKERMTAEAEIAAITDGRDASVYRQILADLDQQRRLLCARKEALSPDSHGPEPDPRTTSQIISQSLTRLQAVLTADEITTAEKNALLGKVIGRIEPGEEETMVELHPVRTGATVKRVVTLLSYG